MAKSWAVEAKVAASTLASAVVGTVIAVLNDVETDSELLHPLPAPIQTLVLIGIPSVSAFLAGWSARHTSRPDLNK